MTYDDAKYQTRMMVTDLRATYAALLGTTATNTNWKTSAGNTDRLEFFRKIKLIDFAVLPEVAPDCGAHATSQTIYAELCLGTVTYARASLGTVAGVMADGTIVTANVAAGTAMNLRAAVTGWDGTVQTMSAGAFRAYIEYQERF